ncbi:glycoside hydrolase family 15 protein (plasmid) [Novosphingobium resinovorum]|uniref:glycoside hydrolase family 15 protein n=1 Tax=Novosphingobium TaxID=165696 RepID=UPI001B3C66BA|nr:MULTISPECIES: glycoside hydrolase family 15 protein [Novosphingobium]MBF7015466.1 glycoside hydrolase family 15 protein [Novosphingobium sp. HR1a]WJM30143.1 glycoside hydrolase family 15 protein [Novosphingobium resinovorum]
MMGRRRIGERSEGQLALEDYGAIGEGRSIALSGADGSIDWWCAPNMDSPPLFDRLLDPVNGGCFAITPDAPFTVERCYRSDSNVLETTFTTETGRARLVESMNSGSAGRLPWAEMARRLEGLEGRMRFCVTMRPGRRGDTVNPYHSTIGDHTVFHVERVLGLFLHSGGVECHWADEGVTGAVEVKAGGREVLALIAGQDEPLVVPSIAEIDARIETSDQEWRTWARTITCQGEPRAAFVRSALALKLLLYSPSGAIAAAPTTSLPERIGGSKNYDYRYAWVRDAGYTIKAFLAAGAQAEAKAAFSWLLDRLAKVGFRVCYTLGGDPVPPVREWAMPGYRGSRPVVTGNQANDQSQHGVYGDIFETASCFVGSGNILDSASAELLSHLADECADRWRMPDAGIWELPEYEHYTMSKISCWQALARAVELADAGQLPTTCRERWFRERDRIAAWIEENCWSQEKQAFVMHPGTDRLDASIALAVRFGFDGRERLAATLDAIDRELGTGPFHYRYSGMDKEEGCFLACSFWMAEARASLGDWAGARARLTALVDALERGAGIYPEMVDPKTGEFLGNLPQGLTHLAHIMAQSVLAEEPRPG